MEDRTGWVGILLEAPAKALPPICGALPAGWQDMPVLPQQLAVPPPASAGDPSSSSATSSSSGCMMGSQAPRGHLSLDTLAASLSESLLPSALLAHVSASDGKTSSSNSSSGSSSSGGGGGSGSSAAAPVEAVGGVSIEQCPPPPQLAPLLQPPWAPAADPILAYGSARPASSTPQLQLQLQQQNADSKGRARRQRQQQEEDIPRQYATSTAFFAGVSPIATEAGLLSVFEQFGTVIRVNLFRPYKTCKTSKGCGLVVFSKPSEAALAMETLSGRFVWPGARSPIILEWGNCSRPQPQQQQQQQAVARVAPAASAAAAGLVSKGASLSPSHLMPAGSLLSNALVPHPINGQPGQLLPAGPLMQAPQQYQPHQIQQQQQAVLLVPQGVSLSQGFAPSIQVAGGTAGQLVVLARY